jgi:hypothetical protein
MLSFLRAQTFEDPELGRFKRVRTMWPAGLGVTMEGGKERPSPEVAEVARRLLRDPDPLVQAATKFVQADAKALEFIEGNGQLICDGFTVYQSGSFAVEFSLSGWPDAMISVPFVEHAPSNVLLGD